MAIADRTWSPRQLLRRRSWLWRRRRDFYRLRSRTKLYYEYWRHHATPITPLLVIGTARVGSYLLTSYLHSLPDVAMRGEVLNPDAPQGLKANRRHRAAALRHIRVNIRAQSAPVGGVKILLGQLAGHGLTVADLCSVMPGTRFLVIYRRALADQFVSMLIARKTGSWNLTDAERRRYVSVHVDPGEFALYCAGIRKVYRELLSHRCVTDRALVLSYEALAQDADNLFRRQVCPFLGVPYRQVRTGFVKQNPSPLSEKVQNYDEVADLLTGPEAEQDYALEDRPSGDDAVPDTRRPSP